MYKIILLLAGGGIGTVARDAKLAMLNIMANNVLSIGMVIIGLMVSSALMKL